MTFKKIIFIIVFLFITIGLNAQFVRNIGTPFYKNYSSEYLGEHPQNWNLAQDSLGSVYIANYSSLIKLSGKNKYKIPLNNLRTLHYDNKTGKMYFGTENSFGFVVYDNKGKPIVNYLSNQVKGETDNCMILNIHTINSKKYYIGINDIFIYKSDKLIKILHSDNGFRSSFKDKKSIYIRELGVGLVELFDDVLSKVKSSELIGNESIHFVINYSKDTFLMGSRINGLYFLIKKNNNFIIEKFKTKIDNYFVQNNIVSGIKLKDGNFAIGTFLNGIIIVDKKMNPIQIHNATQGMLNNNSNCLLQDKEGNIWIGTNNGVTMINYSTKIGRFEDKYFGIDDLIIEPVIFHNSLYYATFNGFYKVSKIDINKYPDFKLPYIIEKTSDFKESYMDVENCGDYLLLSGRNGVYMFDGNNIKRILENTQNISSHIFPFDSTIVFIGTFDGMIVLKNNKGKWDNLGKVKSLNGEIRYLDVYSENEIFISSLNGVNKKIEFKSIENLLNSPNIILYDSLSLGYKDFGQVGSLNRDFYLLGNKYRFKYNSNKKQFVLDTLSFIYDKTKEDDGCNLADITEKPITINGINYYYGTNVAYFITEIKEGKENNQLSTLPFRQISNTGFFNIAVEQSANKIYFSGPSGLFYYQTNNKKKYDINYNVYINTVLQESDTLPLNLDNKNIELDYKSNKLEFIFNALIFEGVDNINYKYYLEGFDEDWSSWSPENRARYTNLPYGEYSFKVKAKNIYSNESNVQTYSFTILAPWYLSWWALVLGVLIFILVIRLIIYLYIKRLKAANTKLESVINERTKEIKLQNEELEKLSVIAKETDNAIMVLGAEGNIEWINESTKNKYGFTVEEIINKYGENIEDFSLNPNIKNVLKELITTNKPQFYNSKGTFKNDQETWIRTTLTPVFNDEGEIAKIIILDSDITEIKNAEEKIKQQNELITYSINYSRKIQQAVMPKAEDLADIFPESFVTLKPKDIVSGDFYWFYKYNNLIYIVGADSTGHGVPGAFMSLIGQMILNETIKEKNIKDPVDILTTLNNRIIETLNQEHGNLDSQNDGMDLSLLCFNTETNELEIASANQTVYIFNKSESLTINGDIFSVGGLFSNTSKVQFTSRKIILKEDTSIYLFSDGFQDQFNNETGEKFMVYRFRQMINDNFEKPMQEQQIIYSKIFAEWKGKGKQIDDILLIGIRYKVNL